MSVVPQKRYYKISEVSALTGLESHVLRFWEGEFPVIRPKRTESGQRMYRRRDIDAIFEIKRLLHDERYTIEGAKKMLGSRACGLRDKEESRSLLGSKEIEEILEELREIRAMV
ncbi:MAG: MerR family transcriptional regulator [Desulfobacterales bacterium]|nr:MerR family transcriptional regulator [Desulfobacterales bacterium]